MEHVFKLQGIRLFELRIDFIFTQTMLCQSTQLICPISLGLVSN